MLMTTKGEAVAVGGLSVTARLTPGHAEDGVTFVIEGWPHNAPSVAVVATTAAVGGGRASASAVAPALKTARAPP